VTAAGTMRHRIELYAPTQTQDATTGSMPSTFPGTPTATRWGSYEPLAGNETFRVGQVVAEADALFKLKFYTGLDATHQLKFDARTWKVLRVDNPDGRKLEHWVWAKEHK